MVVLKGVSPYTIFQRRASEFPSNLHSVIDQAWVVERYNKILAEQQRKFITKILNPFNLCPISVTFWFPITQYIYVGVRLRNLKEISFSIRQQIEPNDTMHLQIQILQFKLPFPLTLLTTFSALGLFVNGAIDQLIENSTTQAMNEQEDRLSNLEEELDSLSSEIPIDPSQIPPDLQNKVIESIAQESRRRRQQVINPFNLCPKIAVYFPIFKRHVAIGVNFTDLQRLSISIRQALEPTDIILSTIRFIELKVPFPLAILALFLSVGLFLNGGVNEFEQETRSAILNEVKHIYQKYGK